MSPHSLLDQARILELRAALGARKPVIAAPDGDLIRSQAAVALVLRVRETLDLLLIKRARMEQDPWSGHMALPGGRRDPSDLDLLRTAIRETHEETGIDLATRGIHLGRLSDVAPRSRRLPPLAISPHVFAIPEDVPVTPSPREVEEVHWVPLTRLVDPATHATVPIQLGEITREFPAFMVEDRIVWGLTHRIIIEFMEVMEPLEGIP
jgi:8-oxo-dGTP pyrophosphatase MutT (NUDIX family)